MKYTNQRIILTGASSGIGRELAIQLAAEGAKLALAARNESLLTEVAELCREAGGEAIVVPTDVTDQKQCIALVARTVREWGGVDALFSNAGVSMFAPFRDVKDLTFFNTMMQVNYFGALYCTHAVLPYLFESKGQIMVMSSMSSQLGSPFYSGYAASKWALNGFFESLRTEIHGRGVGITIVCPEFVDTAIRLHGFSADGTSPDTDPMTINKGMSAKKAAAITIKVAKKRKRLEIMTLLAKVGFYIGPFVPGLIDSIARSKTGFKP